MGSAFVEVLEAESVFSLMVKRGTLWPRTALGSAFVEVLESESVSSLVVSRGILWP